MWNLDVLKKISLSLSPLKQKRWLNHFVLSPFEKIVTLRDVGLSQSKIQLQLNLKSRSSAQYACIRYLKNNSFEAQKLSEYPQKCQKNQMLATNFLKDLSVASIQFPVVQLDKFSTNMAFIQKMLEKVSLQKKSKCFRSKWSNNLLKKLFSFWQNVVFTD